tara:strand:- start:39761 stop:40891 length:1131 start_codon:yes stop_codon:yes gene_type:complete
MENDFIPVNAPLIGEEEKILVNNCLDTGWISSEGGYIKEFEEKIAFICNRKYAIAVTSGTAAIDIAIASSKLKEGDEIIVPTFTIISCISEILRRRIKPIFIDVNPRTWNIDVEKIERKISAKTKAIMAVHIYGLPVEMEKINSLAKKYNLFVIEDAAEMLGQIYYGKPCGSFGDISTLSFYPNKHITTGEGGMILTNSSYLYERCKSLRNLCFMAEERFIHYELGWNYRMTNLQAALGIGQLKRLPEIIKRKREIGNLYNKYLKNCTFINLPVKKTDYSENIYWVYGITINHNTITSKILRKELLRKSIGSRPFFYPLHKQPVLENYMPNYKNLEKLPQSEEIWLKGLYLPSGIGIKNEEIKYVSDKLKEIFESY